jgi:hypothetical protein
MPVVVIWVGDQDTSHEIGIEIEIDGLLSNQEKEKLLEHLDREARKVLPRLMKHGTI